jgi:DNA ligase N terminus
VSQPGTIFAGSIYHDIYPIQVGPLHEGLELGLGESILMKAVASSTGKTLAAVKALVSKQGDLGKVVQVKLYSIYI